MVGHVQLKQLGFVLLCSVSFGILGSLAGLRLGLFLPDYYRSVFASSQFTEFNPIAVGFGQGLTQGLVAGGGIGILLIVINLFSKRSKTESADS